MSKSVFAVFTMLFAFSCNWISSLTAQQLKCPTGPSHIGMESGQYSSQPGVSFQLRHFSATLVPIGKTLPSCMDKLTEVAHADIFVSNESLTRVFAKKLGTTDSKIRDLRIQHDVGTATLSGEITKVIPIKFSIEGPITTDGTSLSMNVTKIVADGIPVKLLLGMVGEQLGSMLSFKGVGGVVVQGNTLSIFPEKVAHLKGYITSVEATPKGLTLHYGRKPATLLASAHRP